MPQINLVDERGKPLSISLVNEQGNSLEAANSGEDQPKPRSFMDSAMDFAKGYVGEFDPRPALKSLYEAVTGQGTADFQKMLAGIPMAQMDQFRKAKDAYDQGRYSEAAGHTLAGALPLVGPAAAQAGETIGEGKVAEGLGAGTALLTPSILRGGSEAVRALKPAASAVSKLNPAEQAAVGFAEDENIPLTAGTRSGSRLIKNAEALVQNAPGGSGYAEGVRSAQTAALAETGNKLAGEVNPPGGGFPSAVPGRAVTAEAAGNTVKDALNQKIADLNSTANDAYGKLREIENRPENTVDVSDTPAGKAARAQQAFNQMLDQSVDARLEQIRADVRSGSTEMTGRAKREYVNPDDPFDVGPVTGRFAGGFKKSFSELANINAQPGEIASAIERGKGPLYDQARSAVRQAVIDNEGDDIRVALRDVDLPVEAKDVKLPVDMRPVKTALKPIYEQLKQTMPITQQNASVGLKALENIMSGDDYVSASIADRNLSVIKGMARTDNPNLRNIAQGTAAAAVKQLEMAVQAAVAKGGPDATAALQAGRQATKAKYAVAQVLDSLPDEPVKVFDKLSSPKDTNVNLLRDVAQHAPEAMPQIGRAYVEGLLEKATAEGGFDKTGTILNKWNSLGQATKQVLFPDGALRSRLDNFFLLAKKLAENPNPSGTALVGQLIKFGEGGLVLHNPASLAPILLSNAALSRLLFSDQGARLLTKVMTAPKTNAAIAASSVSQLLKMIGPNEATPYGQTGTPELAPAQ